MEEIAKTLKEARYRLGLSLEEAERSTRIRAHYLEALEEGDIQSVPSQVQARGFLKNYSEYLGLDSGPILQRYTEVIHSQRTLPLRRTRKDEQITRPSVSVRRRRISADLVIAAVITLTVLAVLIWGFGLVASSLRDQAQAASPFLIPTFTPTAEDETSMAERTVVVVEQTPTPPSIEIPAIQADVIDLRLLIERRAWFSVEVDGEIVENRRAAPGELLEFQGDELIKLTTGNGGGIRVFFGGVDQGLLGELNEVVTRFWVREGAITPTPSATPQSSG
ncbi:MAG: helix-turn-helix domain-containing protein [Anaerolineales bacterium]